MIINTCWCQSFLYCLTMLVIVFPCKRVWKQRRWRLDAGKSENKKRLYQNTRKTTTNTQISNQKQQISKSTNVKPRTNQPSLCFSIFHVGMCVCVWVCIRAIFHIVTKTHKAASESLNMKTGYLHTTKTVFIKKKGRHQ